MHIPGTYANGFAPRDGMPMYSWAWNNCVAAFNPALGPTGMTMRDWSFYRNHCQINPSHFEANRDWILGEGQHAFRSTGINTGINFGNAPQYTLTNLTMAIWIKARETPTDLGAIFSKGYHVGSGVPYFLDFRSGVIGGGLYRQSGNATEAISTTTSVSSIIGKWVHVGLTMSDKVRIYLNGKMENETSRTLVVNNAMTLQIGGIDGLSRFSPIDWKDASLHNIAMQPNQMATLALRPGIAYELAPRRRNSTQAEAEFKAYWAARRSQLIGGGY